MKEQDIPQANTSQEDIIANILEFLPAECGMEVNLPSRGQFYQNKQGRVTVKPLDFEGEKKILSLKRSDLNPIDVLLDMCVEGIDTQDLCSMDRLYLILKIREASHGEELTTTTSCKHCEAEAELNIMLSQLNTTYVPEDMTDPRTIHLEELKKDIEIRMPRVRDDKHLKSPDMVMSNLWRFVVSIDGVTSSPIISQIIPKLPTKDRHKLIKEIMNIDYGVDTKVKFECDECERVNIIDLPLTEDFFTVK
jgi:hypothetical protein